MFAGCVLKPGSKPTQLSCNPEEIDGIFHVCRASLGPESKPGKNYIRVHHGSKVYNVCCLENGKQDSVQLDLMYTSGEEEEAPALSFSNSGASEVHLVGYMEPFPEYGMSDSDDEIDSDGIPIDDDISEDDSEVENFDDGKIEDLDAPEMTKPKSSDSRKTNMASAIRTTQEEDTGEEDDGGMLDSDEEDDPEDDIGSDEEDMSELDDLGSDDDDDASNDGDMDSPDGSGDDDEKAFAQTAKKQANKGLNKPRGASHRGGHNANHARGNRGRGGMRGGRGENDRGSFRGKNNGGGNKGMGRGGLRGRGGGNRGNRGRH